jgi:hypothetical protein
MNCSGCCGGCKGCDGCSGCSGTCQGCNGCSSCSGCSGGCSSGCTGSCNGCSGCSGCSTSCDGGCSGSCTGGCGSSCSGDCSGTCNDACTDSQSANDLANIADNIINDEFIREQDFNDLKEAIDYELVRRGKGGQVANYNTSPGDSLEILTEHINKVIDDAGDIDNSFSLSNDDIVKLNDLKSIILHVQHKKIINVKN